MKIFLTGGAGYIGSVTADGLLRAGHEVTIYDSLITGHRAAVPNGVNFVHAELSDRATLAEALMDQGFDAVLHMAASTDVGASMHVPGDYFQNNVINSLSLIERAHQAGIGRFVFSSTYSIYHSSKDPLQEDSVKDPKSVYSQGKLMVEQALNWYHSIFGLGVAILRYSNAAGSTEHRGEDHTPEPHMIPRILQVAMNKRAKFVINGNDHPTQDGTPIRDFVHIEDLALANKLALENLEKESRMVYNVGNGIGTSIQEVITAARNISGHPIPVVFRARRPGDPSILVASSQRIRQSLGWKPKFDNLEQIVASAWNWLVANPEGYSN
ncbi:MAG: UDP-glucose 4-epimerase GalE [Chloroflexi bacterium]|nr:UDP-glucose 4-epimerase GalE [Chloroflexota bacterium]